MPISSPAVNVTALAQDATVAKDATVARTATTVETGTDSVVGGAGGAWRQLVASSAAGIRRIKLNGVIDNNDTVNPAITILIGTGGGGAEVPRSTGTYNVVAIGAFAIFDLDVQLNLPAGTRVAWKPSVASGIANFRTGYTIEEA